MNDEPRTTVSIYAADLEWLKQHQLRLSGQANKWLPMPDIVRQLVHEADLGQQEGIVMVPVIEDVASFSQRTNELRARGFTQEADSRDKYLRERGYKT